MLYTISGKVVRGDGYGRVLGFPTVNLKIKEKKAKEFPPEGVYAGIGVMGDKEYRTGIVIGPDSKVEAHLIGYRGDAYGKTVTLEVKRFLREYKKFKTEQELITQIKKDLKVCSQA